MSLVDEQERIVEAICSDTSSSVFFIVAPRQFGKRTILDKIRDRLGVLDSDFLYLKDFNSAALDAALELSRYHPVGTARLISARVWTSLQADHLLPLLKEVEDYVSDADSRSLLVVLAGPDVIPASILARGRAYYIAEPSSDAPGLPGSTLQEVDAAKPAVLQAVRAIASADRKSLEEMSEEWTDMHTDLLVGWCYEKASGRWRNFC